MQPSYDDTARRGVRLRKMRDGAVAFLTVVLILSLVKGSVFPAILSAFAMIYVWFLFVIARSEPAVSDTMLKLVELVSPDEWAVYSSFPFKYVTMKKLDTFITLRNELRLYVCRGVERDMTPQDRLALSLGRVARKTRPFNCINIEGGFVDISRGRIIIPHPRERNRMIEGYGFKAVIRGVYTTLPEPEELASLISGLTVNLH
ncbi:hypothetical protein [Archaeoglobus veneficus]|uniref:Uncharacterized protein n=1 Tax=Archaeoglobus veneficus (strain DSM 11195 / SNP6) TaxID=693661 RepID=F2KQZ2_ARCVS|nr:hypothetical protein [Archaeoglobus veneficus]AEA47798.1 hypothetical protein Arcve_1802 [Archaeoglobus veneficus SNP6]